MIKGEFDYLDELARRNLCAEHQGMLQVTWLAKESCYVLSCEEDHYPDTLVRNPSATELFKQGKLAPGPVADKVKKGMEKRAAAQSREPVEPERSLIPRSDLATGELLTPGQVESLMAYARKYELDPFRGHVVLMYGKPYFTLDAYLYHAHQTNIPYQLKRRPLTDEERKTYQVPEDAHAWVCEIIKGTADRSFTGLGIVTREEMTEESKKTPSQLRSPVVAAHPWQLAQKRAEWQALRRAFPIGETKEEEDETGDKSPLSR